MTDLTIGQREVAALVALGYSDKQISDELGMCDRRVRTVIARICDLAHLSRGRDKRAQITRWWLGASPSLKQAA